MCLNFKPFHKAGITEKKCYGTGKNKCIRRLNNKFILANNYILLSAEARENSVNVHLQ